MAWILLRAIQNCKNYHMLKAKVFRADSGNISKKKYFVAFSECMNFVAS
jgi:hypothetical protein